MKIIVDHEKCIGALPCLAIAPNTFRLDREHKAIVKNSKGDDEKTILLAARACPVKAIRLEDDNGKEIFPGTEFEEDSEMAT